MLHFCLMFQGEAKNLTWCAKDYARLRPGINHRFIVVIRYLWDKHNVRNINRSDQHND